jgi:orotate phosphoribosyltransferase
LECSELVKSVSAKIVGYACIIDRSNGKSVLNEKIVSQVKLIIPTYTKDKLPKNLSSIKAVKPGSRNL